jgi:hypothetical protein
LGPNAFSIRSAISGDSAARQLRSAERAGLVTPSTLAVGSGLTEKAIFTWFASRPIAQARAAALTSLLPNDPAVKPLIDAAVRDADHEAIRKLAKQVLAAYGGNLPVVLAH